MADAFALARAACGAPEGERAPQVDALRKQRCLWRASAPEVPVHGNMHRRRADQINLRLSALRFPLYVPEASLFCACWWTELGHKVLRERIRLRHCEER